MTSLPSDILVAIKALARQNQSLQQTLEHIQQDSCQLRHVYEKLTELFEALLDDNHDPKKITWPAHTIAEKTDIPVKTVKKAMRTGELSSIPVHRRGRGYVRVATPESVYRWLNVQTDKHKNIPTRSNPLPRRRKPPNVVF